MFGKLVMIVLVIGVKIWLLVGLMVIFLFIELLVKVGVEMLFNGKSFLLIGVVKERVVVVLVVVVLLRVELLFFRCWC